MLVVLLYLCLFFFFSSRRRHTRCALVTGVQTCALPIFGHRDGEDPAAADDVREQTRLLFVSAEIFEIRRDQPAVDRHEETRVAVKGVLLDQGLLIAEAPEVLAAVLLVGPHAEEDQDRKSTRLNSSH